MLRRTLPALLVAAAALPGLAQPVVLNERTITAQEWTRLRNVVESFRSEEATRKLYRESPGLQEAFPAETYFMAYILKWRPRIEALAKERPKATNVALTLKELDEGDEWFMTFHHAKPKHAITMVKTTWRDGQIRNVSFMRGFTEVSRGRK